jgi:hypothetical protein
MKDFNSNFLVNGFKQLLDKVEYRKQIEKDINDFLRNKKELDKDPNSLVALEKLGELIASRNYYRRKYAKLFREEFKKIEHSGSGFFSTNKGKQKFLGTIRKVAFQKDDAVKKVHALLEELSQKSIREWTEDLHTLSQNGKGDKILGQKGRDIYLRDMSYFDRVPMDIHEMRFIIRTGIYHLCSRSLFNPLEKDDLQDAMVNFCKEYLSGLSISGINLSKSPGIVDLVIWYHCADPPDGFSICAVEPRCLERKDVCPLSKACLFAVSKNKANVSK